MIIEKRLSNWNFHCRARVTVGVRVRQVHKSVKWGEEVWWRLWENTFSTIKSIDVEYQSINTDIIATDIIATDNIATDNVAGLV